MSRWTLLSLAVTAALCVTASACDDDEPATGATGGAAGATTTGGGAAGAASTGTGGGGAASGCYGDADAWDQIQKTDIPCVHNSDCCVVFNGCLGQAQVVSADDFDTAGEVWPYCDAACVLCILPVVEVECQQGECVGYELEPDEDAGVVEGQDHCGVDDPVGPITVTGMHFSC